MALSSDQLTSVADGAVQSTASVVVVDDEWLMKRFVSEFRDGLYTYRDGKSAALIGVYVLLFVASVVGNIAVLTVVLPFRRMRSVTHYFIINLAVADLLCMSLRLVASSLAVRLLYTTSLSAVKPNSITISWSQTGPRLVADLLAR